MEALDWLAAWPGAVWLQNSGTAYLFVNAAHILGIGLLLGAILPLDLHLLGLLRSSPSRSWDLFCCVSLPLVWCWRC